MTCLPILESIVWFFFQTFSFYFTIKPEIEMKKNWKKNRQMAEFIPKHFGGLSTNPWMKLKYIKNIVELTFGKQSR